MEFVEFIRILSGLAIVPESKKNYSKHVKNSLGASDTVAE